MRAVTGSLMSASTLTAPASPALPSASATLAVDIPRARRCTFVAASTILTSSLTDNSSGSSSAARCSATSSILPAMRACFLAAATRSWSSVCS